MMTEQQILDLTTALNEEGGKIKHSRKQLGQAILYWAMRCTAENRARQHFEELLKEAKAPAGLIVPNGFARN